MHSYWHDTISNDRVDALRRAAEQHRMVALTTTLPAEPIFSRLHQRLAALFPTIAPMGPQPQACTC